MMKWLTPSNLVAAALVVVMCMGISVRAIGAPPATPVRPVTDMYHGVKVVDPYRWLETDQDPEVKAWSDAQNAYARTLLRSAAERGGDPRAGHRDHVGQVAELCERDFRGGRYFAIKSQPPKQQPMLIVLDSLDDLASERVVVDPNAIDPTGGTSMDWYVASPDGQAGRGVALGRWLRSG